MEKSKLKEVAQEKGFKVLSYKTELLGIPQTIDGVDMIIPVSHAPKRIEVEDYSETREVYKARRKMVKFVEKQYEKGRPFWNSEAQGTYKKQTEEQVMAKYKDLIKDEKVADKLMEMDQKLQEVSLEDNEDNKEKEGDSLLGAKYAITKAKQ